MGLASKMGVVRTTRAQKQEASDWVLVHWAESVQKRKLNGREKKTSLSSSHAKSYSKFPKRLVLPQNSAGNITFSHTKKSYFLPSTRPDVSNRTRNLFLTLLRGIDRRRKFIPTLNRFPTQPKSLFKFIVSSVLK